MSWNNIPEDERLRLWKNLRSEISLLKIEQQMVVVAEFFSKMPYGARTIDYFSPKEWPTPWEILYRGTFCKNSISLLMFYTFTLQNNDIEAELYLIDDGEDIYLIPVIKSQFALNYELGKVNNLQEIVSDMKILDIYTRNHINAIA